MKAKRIIQVLVGAVLVVGTFLNCQAVESVESASSMGGQIEDCAAVVVVPQTSVEDEVSIDECLFACLDECFETLVVSAEMPEKADSEKVIRVAVIDFTSAVGESFTSCDVTMKPMDEAGPQFSDAVASRIAGWSQYEVASRDEVARVVKQHKLTRKGLHSEASLQKLADLLDVQIVLVGQTEGTTWSGKGHAGGSLYASLQMLSAASSDVLWSMDGSVTDTQTPRHLISSLADDMTGRLYAEIQAVESVQSMLALHTVEH